MYIVSSYIKRLTFQHLSKSTMSNNANNKSHEKNEILPKFPYTAKPVTHSIRNNSNNIQSNDTSNNYKNKPSRPIPKQMLSGKPAYYPSTQSVTSNSPEISSEEEDDAAKSGEFKKSIILDNEAYQFVYSREEIYSFLETSKDIPMPEELNDWPSICLPECWEMETPAARRPRVRSSHSESMDTRARHINIINEEIRKNEMVFSPQRKSFVRGCVYPVSSAPPRSPSNVCEYDSTPQQIMEPMSSRGHRYVPPHERGPSGPIPTGPNLAKGGRPADVEENWRGSRMRRSDFDPPGHYRRRTMSEDDTEPEWMLYGPQSCTETITLRGLGPRGGHREMRHSYKRDDDGEISDEDAPEWLEFGPVSQTECVELKGLTNEADFRRKFQQRFGEEPTPRSHSDSGQEDEPEWAKMELSELDAPEKKPELLNNLFGNISLVQGGKPLPARTLTLDQLEHGGGSGQVDQKKVPLSGNGANPINAMNNMPPSVFEADPRTHAPPNNSGVFQQLLSTLQVQKQVPPNPIRQPIPPQQLEHTYKDMNTNFNLIQPRPMPNSMQAMSSTLHQPFQLPNTQMPFRSDPSSQHSFPPLQRPIVRMPSDVLSNPQTNEKVESRIRDLFKVKEAIIQEPLTQEEKIILINRIDENIKQLRALALKLNDPNSQSQVPPHMSLTPGQSQMPRPQMTHNLNELSVTRNPITNLPLSFSTPSSSLTQPPNPLFSSQSQTLGMNANSFQNQNLQQQPIAFLQQLLARNMTPRGHDLGVPMVGAMGRGMPPPINISTSNPYSQRPQQMRPPQNTLSMQANATNNSEIPSMDHFGQVFGNSPAMQEQPSTLLQMQERGPPMRPVIATPFYQDGLPTQK